MARGRLVTVALVVAATLLVAGIGWRLGTQEDAGAGGPTAAPAATTPPAPRVREPAATEPVAARAPVRVQVPALGVDAAVEDLHIDGDGRLRSPRDWQRTGWFATGTVPGDVGPAVLAGHLDSPEGPAVFAGLDRLRPGDLVEVQRADGRVVAFRVDRRQTVARDDFPTSDVYGLTPDPQLRLITCTGPYLGSAAGYRDNLVVYASLAGNPER